MARPIIILWKLVILLNLVNLSLQKDREFVIEHENIVSDCEIMPPGFVTEDKFLDRSKLTFKRGGDGLITVSGNATFVWDIQSSDRIEVSDQTFCHKNIFHIFVFQLDLSLWKFERGKWKPTPYNSIVKDFCKVLHDKNQPHYSYTIAHVLNKDYTKDRCFTPGVNELKHTLLCCDNIYLSDYI